MNLLLSESGKPNRRSRDSALLIRKKNDAKKSNSADRKQSGNASSNVSGRELPAPPMPKRQRHDRLQRRGGKSWRRQNKPGLHPLPHETRIRHFHLFLVRKWAGLLIHQLKMLANSHPKDLFNKTQQRRILAQRSNEMGHRTTMISSPSAARLMKNSMTMI